MSRLLLLVSILAAIALAAVGTGAPARAEPASAPTRAEPASAPTRAEPAPAAITPDQARAAIQVLNDPKQRAALTAALEAIAKAPAAEHPAPPATTATPQPVAPAKPTTPPAAKLAIPLAPNSLGAEVLVSAEKFLDRASTHVVAALHTARSLPQLWDWAVIVTTDSWARALLLDTAWRLAVTLIFAAAAEYGLRRAVNRPIRVLEGWAPDAPVAAEPQDPAAAEPPADGPPAEPSLAKTPAPDSPPVETSPLEPPPREDPEARAEAGEIEPPLLPGRRPSAWVMLRRLHLVLARFLLDLIPIVGFALAGHLVAGTAIGSTGSIRLILLAVVDAYVLSAAVLALVRMLISPRTARLRLFFIANSRAAWVVRWTRRIVVIAVFGYATAEVGSLLGMSDEARLALLKTVSLVVHVCLAIMVLQSRRLVARLIRGRTDAGGATARIRLALAAVWHWIAVMLIMALWVVWAVEVPNGFTWLLHFTVITGALLIGARLLLIVLTGIIDRALNVPMTRFPGLEGRVRLYHPVIGALLRAGVYALTLLALLQLYGLGGFTWFAESNLGPRIVGALSTLVITFMLAIAVWEAANAAIHVHLERLAREQQAVRSARLRTLLPLLRSALAITILVFAGLTVLSEIGINIAPLLAGAGIIGVAIGFGSQKLVQDLITGIFLLLENAMQVGDWVTVSGLSGTVENLSVRTIRLRAGDGSVHIIPFSAVTTVTNVNRGLGNASVSVVVEFNEDTDHVAAVLTEIVAGMRAEPDFAGKMLSDLQLWGVDKVDGAGVTIAGQVVCIDSGRWSVQREFNRRMKKRFQELGIKLFNPMRSIAVPLPPPSAAIEPNAAAEPNAATKPNADIEEEHAHERSRAAD